MKNVISSLFASAAIGMAMFTVSAEDQAITYSNISDQSYLSGPRINPNSMKGKVVLWEYWGRNCPPCLASLPHLQDLWKKYGKTGKFLVVGSHCQDRDEEAIKKILSKNNVTYPVYQNISTSSGRPSGGIPFAVLTDHTGKVVATGNPTPMYDLVPKLVKAAPDSLFIIGCTKITHNKSLASKLMYGKNLEGVIVALDKKAQEATPAGKEAKEISDMIASWKESFQEEIRNESTSALSLAYEKMTAYRLMFPSDATYKDELNSLKGNRNLALLTQIRKEMKSEQEKYSKKNKPSKAAAARFATISKKLEKITDEKFAGEVEALTTELQSMENEATPK